MKKRQISKIFYNFRVNGDSPLDDKLVLSNLANINTELPIEDRYLGLLFFVTNIKKYYTFTDDLNTPVLFSDSILSSQKNGIFIDTSSNDYSNLPTLLGNTNPKLGNIVTVYPLQVSFIFDGTNWKYFNGKYNGTTPLLLTIPQQLRQTNALLISEIGGVSIWNNQGNITPEILVITDPTFTNNPYPGLPISTLQTNRYYLVNGLLYYVFNNGQYFLIGDKVAFFQNQLIGIGETTIIHNLNTSYIRGLIRIQIDINTFENCEAEIIVKDKNTINIKSSVIVSNCSLILNGL